VRYSTAAPLVAALILLGVAALFAPLLFRYKKLNSIEGEIELLQPDVSYMEELKREAGEIQGGLEQLRAAGSGGWPVLSLLKELTKIIPEDTWVTNLVYKNDTVEITGYSSSASALIPIIERSPFFTGVEFTAPVTTVNRSSAIRGFGSRYISGRAKGVLGKSRGGSMEQFKIKALEEERL
jgi:general secretion pathway protein L